MLYWNGIQVQSEHVFLCVHADFYLWANVEVPIAINESWNWVNSPESRHDYLIFLSRVILRHPWVLPSFFFFSFSKNKKKSLSWENITWKKHAICFGIKVHHEKNDKVFCSKADVPVAAGSALPREGERMGPWGGRKARRGLRAAWAAPGGCDPSVPTWDTHPACHTYFLLNCKYGNGAICIFDINWLLKLITLPCN